MSYLLCASSYVFCQHGEDFNLVDDVFYDDSAIGESMAGVQPIKNGA